MKHEELMAGLKKLFLHETAKQYVEISKLAEKDRKTYEQYLAVLVQIELKAKLQQKVTRLIRQSKIPMHKGQDTFHFNLRKGITPTQFNRLATGEFVRQAGNVVFYGSFGLGKTHLAIALIEELCRQGLKCLFYNTHELINQLLAAKRELTQTSLFKKLDRFDLIVCDELGYVPCDQDGGDLFFQFISQRAERKSLLITTNLTYSEWHEVFKNPRTTAAAVDRIIHKCETFNIDGPSWRGMMAKKNLENDQPNKNESNKKLTDPTSSDK